MNKVLISIAMLMGMHSASAQGLDKTAAEAAASRQWRQWQSEQTVSLPPVRPLAQTDTTLWQIPAELEPNAVMPYFWGSKGEMPASGYPLYIYLHGSGPKQIEWANGLVLAQRFDDAPCLYFIPQIPNEGEYYRWYQQSKQYAWEKLLREALASGLVDPLRIYILGISEGGYGSQRLASFYADYLAGAGPMAGGEPLKNAPVENLRHTAFSLLSGEKDLGFYRNRLTAETGAALDSIAALYPGDFTHRVELIPGAGHGIDYSLTTPWLKEHSRTPQPLTFSWEDFEMDGRHRPGFYNIAVTRRPAEARTRYDMSIDGNNVDLNIQNVEYATTETDPRWGIPLEFARTYTPARGGEITLYLSDDMVNLDSPVSVTINGRRVFSGRLPRTEGNLRTSCETFGDPRRLFPAALHIAY